MMCIEHAVHIAAKHFVETVAPTPPKPLHKKIRKLLHEACSSGELNEEDVATIISSLGGDKDEVPEAEDNDQWTTGDAVGKILALIKQIRMSPQAREFFRKCCVQASVPELELLLWVRTRWASLYKCLDRVLTLQKAIHLFVSLADDSDEVPDLSKDKSYRAFTLLKSEWKKIHKIHEALREPAVVTQTFSSERTPTVWRILPTLEFLIKRWETMATNPDFVELEGALGEGVKSLKKWFHRTDTTSSAYFICLVLNPTIKDVYFRTRWSSEVYKKGMAALEAAFDQYYAASEADASSKSDATAPTIATPPALHRYGSSFLLDAVHSVQEAERANAQPRDELNGYLSTPLEVTDNILHWWGVRGPSHCRLHR
ncbi:ribonuclease H-like domain-containing protein [Mycena latifolia]|nr:ribonuclease H-like domain-containing protein [Mycena latifolia]